MLLHFRNQWRCPFYCFNAITDWFCNKIHNNQLTSYVKLNSPYQVDIVLYTGIPQHGLRTTTNLLWKMCARNQFRMHPPLKTKPVNETMQVSAGYFLSVISFSGTMSEYMYKDILNVYLSYIGNFCSANETPHFSLKYLTSLQKDLVDHVLTFDSYRPVLYTSSIPFIDFGRFGHQNPTYLTVLQVHRGYSLFEFQT